MTETDTEGSRIVEPAICYGQWIPLVFDGAIEMAIIILIVQL